MPEGALISIIDDDPHARDGIRELIESLGYQATAFASADDFLAAENYADTACLITDLQMPGLNGVELLEEMRARGCPTPVIIVTAYPSEKYRTRALHAGAVGFLSKPFNEEVLIERLTAAINGVSKRAIPAAPQMRSAG